VSEAQVQSEATQGAQASGQPVDLQVAVQRLLPAAAGRLALGIEAVGQVGDRLLETRCDGREVLLVAGDQRRVGLGGEVVGKVERTGDQGDSRLLYSAVSRFGRRFCGPTRALPQAPRSAIR
jgi:hypothetical protein